MVGTVQVQTKQGGKKREERDLKVLKGNGSHAV